jgi:hypothetical protein
LHAHCLFIQLELKYAKQTDSLVPPHRYVPWVVVDGQPLLEVSTKIPSKVTCAIFGSSLQETVKFTRAKITYEGPIINYITYDGPKPPS